jgi:serine/threonine-protein kinase
VEKVTLDFTPPMAEERTIVETGNAPSDVVGSTAQDRTALLHESGPRALAPVLEETIAVSDGFSSELQSPPVAPTLPVTEATSREEKSITGGMPDLSAVGEGTLSVADAPAMAKTIRMDMKAARKDVPPPPVVPGYEILGELGRGGMGVVYKASQTGLDRVVALKMVLTGGLASGAELTRFRTEARAVAQLHHPNIVQIYEVGERDGCPYFSLEYLDGGSLAAQIVEAPLPATRAAHVVRALAEAMECAHRAGIVHRDLKPGNVLLAGDGTPKITDFGLAKRIEANSGQTRTGAVLGTPSYMAPEQAEGKTHDIGPAADIYALGAVLYDLVTGRPPFKGESVLDTLEQVRRVEPVPPSRLQATLPRDLDTICLKCLQKEIHKRYATAGALAEDLRRFLEGEPIAARPTSAWERGYKWTRRHPASAALIAVSALALVGFGVGGVAWAVQAEGLREAADLERDHALALRAIADQERENAVASERVANQERARAASNFQDARVAVDQMLLRIGRERLANEPHMDLVRRDLLEKALRFHERFLKAGNDNPEVRWEAGQAYVAVADIQEMLGRPEKAEQAYLQATNLLQPLADEFPERPQYRRDLAAAHANLSLVLQAAGRGEESEQEFQRGQAIRTRLVEVYPEVAIHKWDLAEGHNRRGLRAQQRNDMKEAKASFTEAARLFGELVRDAADKPDYVMDLARARINLATVLQALKRPNEAETEYRGALASLRPLVAQHASVREFRQETARALLNLATLMHLAERFDEAEACYKEAVSLFAGLADEYPTVPDFRQFLAMCSNDFGEMLLHTRKAADAQQPLRQAVDRFGQLAREFPALPTYRQEHAKSLHNLGIMYHSTKRPREAVQVLTEAIQIRTKIAGEYPNEVEPRYNLALSIGEHAIALAKDNEFKKAVEKFRKAIAILDALDRQRPDDAAIEEVLIRQLQNLVLVLDTMGDRPGADQSRARIAELQKKSATKP